MEEKYCPILKKACTGKCIFFDEFETGGPACTLQAFANTRWEATCKQTVNQSFYNIDDRVLDTWPADEIDGFGATVSNIGAIPPLLERIAKALEAIADI